MNVYYYFIKQITNSYEDLKILEWLIGQWEGVQGPGVYHEEWEKISNNEFKGRAYMIMKGEIKCGNSKITL